MRSDFEVKQQRNKMKLLLYFLLIVGAIACDSTNKLKPGQIPITWQDSIAGDFSFKEQWDYAERVYKNEFGQLSCDGLCPSEIDNMKDENGKIYNDSLQAFYKLIDTTHQSHSIQSDATTYEWTGTDFITIEKHGNDSIVCYTQTNSATHSSLNLIISKNIVTPSISFTSIATTGTETYLCNGGQIAIDQNLWHKGIMKATFNITFNHKKKSNKPMYWKGKIYAKIEAKD